MLGRSRGIVLAALWFGAPIGADLQETWDTLTLRKVISDVPRLVFSFLINKMGIIVLAPYSCSLHIFPEQ